ITVRIPPGVDTGSRVRISGEGGPGLNGGRKGDLILAINVAPHSRFERQGDDLKLRLPLDLYTLMLGGEARVPTLDGKTIRLTVPAGTPNGKVFRLSGQGMPRLRSPESRGDLHVTLEALLPARLSERERALVEELRSLST